MTRNAVVAGAVSDVATFPNVDFSPLPHVDGSVSYAWAGFSIICSVNGPIEASRRDELAEEAFVEVNVREAKGAGSPRTRHTELLLQRTLRSLILTHIHPRTLIQLTLQIVQTPPDSGRTAQSDSVLPILPHLHNAAMLALLDANIPLKCTAIAVTTFTVDGSGPQLISKPDQWKVLRDQSTTLQGYAFSGEGGMFLMESEGSCAIEDWEASAHVAEMACKEMQTAWLRKIVGDRLEERTSWKNKVT